MGCHVVMKITGIFMPREAGALILRFVRLSRSRAIVSGATSYVPLILRAIPAVNSQDATLVPQLHPMG
jgi:hypothetical protein